jgi:hypothetical protein
MVLAHEATAEAPPEPAAPKGKSHRTRARHPAGAEEAKPGSFVGDDPETPEDEAWVE